MKNSYTATDKKYLQAFGAHLRALRKAAGFSQDDFALEIGLDRIYMGGVERDERNVALLNLHKIAESLKIPLPALLEFPLK